jgi:hypothetical protein
MKSAKRAQEVKSMAKNTIIHAARTLDDVRPHITDGNTKTLIPSFSTLGGNFETYEGYLPRLENKVTEADKAAAQKLRDYATDCGGTCGRHCEGKNGKSGCYGDKMTRLADTLAHLINNTRLVKAGAYEVIYKKIAGYCALY